jgi:N-acetylmuramoyl-L-alanine amidase
VFLVRQGAIRHKQALRDGRTPTQIGTGLMAVKYKIERAMRAISKLRRMNSLVAVLAAAVFVSGAQPARSVEDGQPAEKGNACQPSGFRVVLDVGHTARVPGADSARGAPEYIFNLQLADTIKQTLVTAGFSKTIRLITARAPWAGLLERAARANELRADLFIAIHHDSVPDNLIEKWEYNGQKHLFSDRFRGYSIFISDANADRKGSLAFGHLLGRELQARAMHYTSHYTLPLMGRHRHQLVDAEAGVYRYDQLLVLRNTLMPAVLLEAGSIVNRTEELELATPERRALISAAVVAAVEEFCAAQTIAHQAPSPRMPGTPAGAKPAASHR